MKRPAPRFDDPRADPPIDPYLPTNGNRGYRVSRYELDLDYRVAGNSLSGTAQITAVTTRPVSRISFDFGQDLDAGKVRVNGTRPAKFAHRDGKLVITLRDPLDTGAALSVAIAYSGHPTPIDGPWGEVGWEELTDGALVASQPNGAASWFPCDDHLSAKASFRISVTTESSYTVVANGVFVGKRVRASRTTWTYEQPEPMSPYLATVQIGRYEQRQLSRSPVKITAATPPHLRTLFDRDFRKQPDMMRVFTRLFGPYPYDHYTVVVADDTLEIPIEAQGISVFGANHCTGRGTHERLIAHELAHQWFGNSVTARRWRDIWLHEGFACYAEWLWSENSGGQSAREKANRAHALLARQPQDIVIGDPGPELMFDDRLYKRGACTLEALRRTIGDRSFSVMLREWTDAHRYGTVVTEDLVDLAGRYGCPREFWEPWLYRTQLPPMP